MALFDGTETLFGRPIPEECRERIRRFLSDPSEASWDDISSIVISNNRACRTVWQAVHKIDETFPRTKTAGEPWPRVPSVFLVARAIRNATQR